MINRELIIGYLTFGLAVFMLARSEYISWQRTQRELMEVRVDRLQAEKQIHLEMGADVTISFQQELYDKYYFRVVDPKNDSTYDVYVRKDHPSIQMLRKSKPAVF